jgi:hypothetical protein
VKLCHHHRLHARLETLDLGSKSEQRADQGHAPAGPDGGRDRGGYGGGGDGRLPGHGFDGGDGSC